jgi:hypothetical protein
VAVAIATMDERRSSAAGRMQCTSACRQIQTMISSLRQRHRRVFIALGIFLPVALTVGIAGRRSVPIAAELPAELAATQKFEAVEWERAKLFTNAPVTLRLLREKNNSGRFALDFSADKNFLKPDLLVYWISEKSHLSNMLPNDALLLGSFGPTLLPLPDEAAKSTGSLVIYSLADNEILGVSKPITPQGPDISPL